MSSTAGGPGRRAAPAPRGSRFDVTTLLAIVVPLVVAAVLAVVRPDAAQVAHRAPQAVPLASATLVCPSALDGKQATETALGVTSAAAGQVTAGDATLDVAPGTLTSGAAQDAPTLLTATGEVAPGLVAALSSTAPLTAYDCAPPSADQWFTGVGAGPTHASVLELVNPHAGPAVVDIDVLTDTGPLEVADLRGITVDGESSRQFDLGQVVPRTGVMALHATVVRGQVGIAVRDRGERVTGGTTTEDWLPAQDAPATTNLLLGVQPGAGRQTLAIVNDSDDQVSASLKLVTTEAAFAPAGVEPVEVPPHTVVSVVLDDVLAGDAAKGTVGLEVDADGPVTAALRSVVGADLSILVPGDAVTASTTSILPVGTKQLVLAGADAVGVATVTARDAAGRQLDSQRISLTPGRAAVYAVPDDAVLLDVVPERASVRGAVLVTGDGAAVVRLRELPRTAPVPAVAPGRE